VVGRGEASIRRYLSREHSGVRGRRGRPGVGGVDITKSQLWKVVVYQRFFGSRAGSNYFVVEEPDKGQEPIISVSIDRIEEVRQVLIRR
jgi:hypothetical protein